MNITLSIDEQVAERARSEDRQSVSLGRFAFETSAAVGIACSTKGTYAISLANLEG
jgi:hypothetical protein